MGRWFRSLDETCGGREGGVWENEGDQERGARQMGE